MLRAIFVFHDHGHLIYSENFQSIGNAPDPPDLISALLSAINMFANQIKAGDVNSVEMQNYALVGLKSRDYSIRFVSIIDRTDRIGECKNFLTNCEKSFIDRFGGILKNLKSGDLVNTDIFSSWEKDLKELTTDIDFSPIETVMGNIIHDITSKLQVVNGVPEKELIQEPLVSIPPVTMVISENKLKKKGKVKKNRESTKKKKAKKKISKKKTVKKKKKVKTKKTFKNSKNKKKGRIKK